MSQDARLTHIALRVRDVAESATFYRELAGLKVVHVRASDSGNSSVIWLSDRGPDADFVVVLFEGAYEATPAPSVDHLGIALSSREAVDAVAEVARAQDALVEGPVDAGPVVGYLCIVRDPDGNRVEFSHGQPIGPGAVPPGESQQDSEVDQR